MPERSVAMALEAGAAVRADDRSVRRPGGKDEAFARPQLDGHGLRTDEERDRARGAQQQLRVAMLMGGISIARAVRPGIRLDALRPEATGDGIDADRPIGRAP